MYKKFYISGQNLRFVVQNKPYDIPDAKKNDFITELSLGFSKLTELFATKMRVFYRKLFPFWIFLLSFLPLRVFFNENIIKKSVFYN